ncbi:uncharacterized protein LOC118195040 [Stegodyphus dumicola]|uniref:uncharacterized protein LOC118195040 n=1 Tax=Stegodyphus dumicola TaxID=202533 RepID=UPI0015AE6FDA|nr:uncharacterized protein LOC118195040 [Stegodyphus dumicola]
MACGTGSGLCVPKNQQLTFHWNRRLSKCNTIYQAELLAIRKALQLAHQMVLITNQKIKITIYSDSASSLEAILDYTSKTSLVQDIQHLLLQLPFSLRPNLIWVKSHQGLFGNELADRLAKEAALAQERIEQALPLPQSYLKSLTWNLLQSKWQEQWSTGLTGRRVFKFIPKVSTKLYAVNSALTWFLSSHGPFKI